MVLVVAAGGARAGEEKHAKVSGSLKEHELAQVVLSESAEQRLGILTVPVARRSIPRSQLFGAEVVLPMSVDPGGTAPAAGGQSIFSLLSEMTANERLQLAQAQIDADGAIKAAEVELEAAGLALNRAEMLLRDKVGSAKAVEEATAARDIASQGVKTARAKRELLGPPSLPVTAPAVVWIKVPVYVGLLASLDVAAEASVGGISGRPGEDTRAARPVAAPPSARAATSTADLFYQVDNAGGDLRPGQKLGIRVPMTESGESLVVPWSAVVYDVNGGAWVYQRTAPLTYARQRVQVRRVAGDLAVLASGPEPGVEVVGAGAAELFGTEFGVGK